MTSGANIRHQGRKPFARAAKGRSRAVLLIDKAYAGLTSLRYDVPVENLHSLKAARLPFLAAALFGIGLAAPAHADVKPADAQIAVVRPLSFIKVEDLDFGRVIASATAGTVTLAPDGTRTRTGGAQLAGTEGSQVARFAGDGTQNQLVTVSVAANSIWIYGPGTRMRVRDFVIGSVPVNNLTTNPLQLRLSSAAGTFNFAVGATLEVGANQTPGFYTGTWTMTLNYQ